MLIGYARVSTDDQLLDLQRDALDKAGCERVFEDTASGAKAERVGLTALLATLRKGGTVVIWRLDRLGRSLKDLIRLVEQLMLLASAYAACKKASTPVRLAVAWCFTYLVPWPSLSAT